jgi:hypothetical protein
MQKLFFTMMAIKKVQHMLNLTYGYVNAAI